MRSRSFQQCWYKWHPRDSCQHQYHTHSHLLIGWVKFEPRRPACVCCTYLCKLFHLPYSLGCIHRCRFQQCWYKWQQRDRGSKHIHQYLHIGLNFRIQHVCVVLTCAHCSISRIAWVAFTGVGSNSVGTSGSSVTGVRSTLINICTLV